MTDDNMALTDLLQKAGEGDFLRTLAETVLQMLMEADLDGHIGAGRHERHPDRLNYRNGYRDRALDLAAGDVELGAFPSCGRAAISRPFWRRARPARRPWWR